MAFGNFTLASAVADFGLAMSTSEPLFPTVPAVDSGRLSVSRSPGSVRPR